MPDRGHSYERVNRKLIFAVAGRAFTIPDVNPNARSRAAARTF
jgi:hypothetical protein